ncbi:alpha/beta hydrolase [Streptomyces sp. NPDC057136]|uniref:alpha/beta hydrolase n=1 Tax=Streptomyces sp. NPDC057136 TaxID=3346029 RepID=UPI00362DF792
MTLFDPRDRIDPQVRTGLDAMLEATGPGGYRNHPLHTRREMYEAGNAAALAATPVDDTVQQRDEWIPGHRGDSIRVRVYEPRNRRANELPVILYLHGGGLNHGSIATDERQARPLIRAGEDGAVVVSVDYRLAPEHPHPYPVEDCYAALIWVADHAVELGIDLSRIVLYGGSAGGGLAAGVSLLARDRGGPAIAYQMLLYPMLDDTNETPSSRLITDVGIWDRDLNIEAWRFLLGNAADADEISEYAAPSRARNVEGLPPTYIDVGELDLFRDEDIRFAARLLESGVPVELHVYPGGIHASELLAPDAELSRRIGRYRDEALERALGAHRPKTPVPDQR